MFRFRRAPEHPFPAPLNDCLTATMHLFENADGFNVDVTRIAVLGKTSIVDDCCVDVILLFQQNDRLPLASQCVLLLIGITVAIWCCLLLIPLSPMIIVQATAVVEIWLQLSV